jgi:hypothetical protein
MDEAAYVGSASDPARQQVSDVAIDTGLGGLFYLLNVGLGLGLYGDFTAPNEPGIGLDIWDLVTLIGTELLGPPLPPDPVWDLLAALTGRHPWDPPGRRFAPSASWRTRAEWMTPLATAGTWTWSAQGGRLRLAHPSGAPALDVPRTVEPGEVQLGRECATWGLGPHDLTRGTLPRLDGPVLRRWVVNLSNYVRARVAVALGVAAADAVDLLLRQRARVSVTAIHVDVAFSLQDHPLEIRLAGLDRDPGWIPAAGRIVAFSYGEEMR